MAQKYADGSGMEQLATIVANLYKDVKLIKSASNLAGAQRYANKHPGWTATKEDITGPNKVPDGVDEILIRDKHGNIRVVNGWTTKPSKFAERQAYWDNVPLWTQAELDADPNLTAIQKRLKLNRPKYSMSKFKEDATALRPEIKDGQFTGNWLPVYPEISGVGAELMRKSKITPKKLFTSYIKTIWEANKDTIVNNEDKLRIYQIWSNGEYIQNVVKPVLTSMGYIYDRIPFAEDLAKITNTNNFKQAAIRQVYGLAQDADFDNNVDASLKELINRGYSPEVINQLYGDSQSKPHKPRANQVE